jgi:hypothetical protein
MGCMPAFVKQRFRSPESAPALSGNSIRGEVDLGGDPVSVPAKRGDRPVHEAVLVLPGAIQEVERHPCIPIAHAQGCERTRPTLQRILESEVRIALPLQRAPGVEVEVPREDRIGSVPRFERPNLPQRRRACACFEVIEKPEERRLIEPFRPPDFVVVVVVEAQAACEPVPELHDLGETVSQDVGLDRAEALEGRTTSFRIRVGAERVPQKNRARRLELRRLGINEAQAHRTPRTLELRLARDELCEDRSSLGVLHLVPGKCEYPSVQDHRLGGRGTCSGAEGSKSGEGLGIAEKALEGQIGLGQLFVPVDDSHAGVPERGLLRVVELKVAIAQCFEEGGELAHGTRGRYHPNPGLASPWG